MKDLLTVLEKARDLISDEKYWCRGHYTEKLTGTPYSAFCAIGAIQMAARSSTDISLSPRGVRALQLAMPAAKSESTVASFNDDPQTTHFDVLALYDRAIEGVKSGKFNTI